MHAGELIAERYRIERLSGAGGMGSVYEAVDTQRDMRVAVKLVERATDQMYLKRFLREARALAELSAVLKHPNIVDYVAHGITFHGQPYLVMEWLEGMELKQRILDAPLGESETIQIGLQVCSALQTAHDHGIIHRDIKPANLFLVDGDLARLKVLDFGLVRMEMAKSMVTQPGRMLGTPGFIAPEQARGDEKIDTSVDLYSLGAVLFTCLAQRPPFVGRHAMAILAKLQLEEAPQVRSLCERVSPGLDDLISSLLDKDPMRRPASAAVVADALRDLSRGISPDPSIVNRAVPAQSKRYSSILLVGLSPPGQSGETWSDLASLADQYQADIRPLAADIAVASFSADRAPTAAAARAARFALSLHGRTASTPLVLATGCSPTGESRLIGEVIDHAVELLPSSNATMPDALRSRAADEGANIVVDEVSDCLLTDRFQLRDLPGRGRVLVGESRESNHTRSPFDRRIRCVGRNRELTALRAAFDASIAGPEPRAVLVTGPPGAGKSRLAREFVYRLEAEFAQSGLEPGLAGLENTLRDAAQRDTVSGDGSTWQIQPRSEYAHKTEPIQIWSARVDAAYAQAPLGPIVEITRRAVGVTLNTPLPQRQLQLMNHLSALIDGDDVERVTVFLGELIGTPFSAQEHPMLEEARADAESMHRQLQQAWLDWLDARSKRVPIVCILDDLHWSDGGTAGFIAAALCTSSQRSLTVVALAQPGVTDIFPDPWATGDCEHLALEPLSTRASAALAGQLTANDLDPRTLRLIVENGRGNPLRLEELVCHVEAGGAADASATLPEMLRLRLLSLPHDECRILSIASVMGTVFWLNGLAGLAARPIDEVLGLVQRLVERDLLTLQQEPRFAGDIEYGFRHPLVCEVAYALLTKVERARAHQAAARWLIEMGETDASTIARHFARAGLSGAARPYFRRSAERALVAGDLAAAVEWAERGIACGAQGETLVALWRLQAEAYERSGAHEAAAEARRNALAVSVNSSP